MNTKQVIVLRKDLNMRKGKMVAQGAHASLGAILQAIDPLYKNNSIVFDKILKADSPVYHWLKNSFTKITLYCESEKELFELQQKAEKAGILNCLITDNGTTEFNGIPTKTALAIGPDEVEKINEITGHLKLL